MIYRVCMLVVACGLIIGCGGSTRPVVVDYDSGRDRTTYRSGAISIPIETRDSGYGSQFKQLRMQLRADCQGRECQPDAALLTLSTSGSSELYLGERTLVITADDEQFTWEDPEYQRRTNPERIVGMVVQVSISIDQLRKMARAEDVGGKIGAVELDIRTRSQARIRDFLARMGYGISSQA